MADKYEVGYGKPPKANPVSQGPVRQLTGRPKGSTNLQTEMKRVLAAKTKTKTKITVDGAVQTVSTSRARVLLYSA